MGCLQKKKKTNQQPDKPQHERFHLKDKHGYIVYTPDGNFTLPLTTVKSVGMGFRRVLDSIVVSIPALLSFNSTSQICLFVYSGPTIEYFFLLYYISLRKNFECFNLAV
uniref:Uncharacterized protein n=1 Tax=Strigamia maritima TaxID=126957 RepID=T1JG73_STRMM